MVVYEGAMGEPQLRVLSILLFSQWTLIHERLGWFMTGICLSSVSLGGFVVVGTAEGFYTHRDGTATAVLVHIVLFALWQGSRLCTPASPRAHKQCMALG